MYGVTAYLGCPLDMESHLWQHLWHTWQFSEGVAVEIIRLCTRQEKEQLECLVPGICLSHYPDSFGQSAKLHQGATGHVSRATSSRGLSTSTH